MCTKNFLKQSIISQVSQQVPGASVGASFGSIRMDLLFLTGFQSVRQHQYKLSVSALFIWAPQALCVFNLQNTCWCCEEKGSCCTASSRLLTSAQQLAGCDSSCVILYFSEKISIFMLFNTEC